MSIRYNLIKKFLKSTLLMFKYKNPKAFAGIGFTTLPRTKCPPAAVDPKTIQLLGDPDPRPDEYPKIVFLNTII
jgi:hypothetical protein